MMLYGKEWRATLAVLLGFIEHKERVLAGEHRSWDLDLLDQMRGSILGRLLQWRRLPEHTTLLPDHTKCLATLSDHIRILLYQTTSNTELYNAIGKQIVEEYTRSLKSCFNCLIHSVTPSAQHDYWGIYIQREGIPGCFGCNALSLNVWIWMCAFRSHIRPKYRLSKRATGMSTSTNNSEAKM